MIKKTKLKEIKVMIRAGISLSNTEEELLKNLEGYIDIIKNYQRRIENGEAL